MSLATDTAGTKMGQISFANNDSDENPFNFPVTGQVSPPPTLVYVDGASDCLNPDGGQRCPFRTFCGGYDAVATCGTVRIHAGSYTACHSPLTKCATLECYDGPVLLIGPASGGQPPDDGTVGRLSAPKRLGDGSIALSFSGLVGQRYQVFASTNLVSWELWKEFTAETETLDLGGSGRGLHADALLQGRCAGVMDRESGCVLARCRSQCSTPSTLNQIVPLV